jgi:hypothetical protein
MHEIGGLRTTDDDRASLDDQLEVQPERLADSVHERQRRVRPPRFDLRDLAA